MSHEDNPSIRGVRAAVVAALDELAPEFTIRDDLEAVTTITAPRILVDYNNLEPLPEAPIGHVRARFNISVIDDHSVLKAAQDAVDEWVVDLILALDGHRWLRWESAKKALLELTPYLMWQLEVSAIASTPTPTLDPIAPAVEPDAEPEGE